MSAKSLYEDYIVHSTRNERGAASGHVGQVARNRRVFERDLRLNPLLSRGFLEQSEIDAAMWYGAIETGPFQDTIRRLFHVFYYGGIIYKTSQGWADWHNKFNVATLLSHGQRVMVQTPQLTNGGDDLFWDWLNEGTQIPKRGWATHGLTHIEHPTPLIKGHKQYFQEKHSWYRSYVGHRHDRHHGFNPALGGKNNRNPFSRANDDQNHTFVPIEDQGRDGHVYIYYRPPAGKHYGGMLVGCENAEVGKGNNPHTAAGHGHGERMKISACGGKKWSEMHNGPSDEYNGFICDISKNWANIRDMELFKHDWLDQPPKKVTEIHD